MINEILCILIIILIVLVAFRLFRKKKEKKEASVVGGFTRKIFCISYPDGPNSLSTSRELLNQLKQLKLKPSKQNGVIIGTTSNIRNMSSMSSMYHIHLCPVHIKSDLVEIALAKPSLLPILGGEQAWNEYWDDLCHLSINCYASDVKSAVSELHRVHAQS
jgi:hypothetical protein